jgi:hypothetical protein
MWQFIKDTGRRYGLVINSCVDERRDPEKSTRAAARYLRHLYQKFGSWYLAIASYNCGENRIQRLLGKGYRKNFWDLSANRLIPEETRKYVPQLMAATIIAKNPHQFGFDTLPDSAPVQLARSRPPHGLDDGLSPDHAAAVSLATNPGRPTVNPGDGSPGTTAPIGVQVAEAACVAALYSSAGPQTSQAAVRNQGKAKPPGSDKAKSHRPTRLAKANPSRTALAAAHLEKSVCQASLFGSPGHTSGPGSPAQARAAHKTPGKAKAKNQGRKPAKKRQKASPALVARN